MKINVRNQGGVTVIAPKGKVTIGVGDVALRNAVAEALEAGARKIVLDLGEVTTLDSSGVGEMVAAYTTVTNREGGLKIANLPRKIQDILQITQLIRVFEVFEEVDEAIASFD